MYLEKNLKALAQKYPHYAQIIANAPNTGRYTLSKTQSNNYNVFDKKLNTYYYNNIDASLGVTKELEDQKIRMPQISVFLGFGLGYHLINFNMKFHDKALAYIIFEPDPEILRIAFTLSDYTSAILQPNVALCLCGLPPQNYYTELYGTLTVGGRVAQYLKTMNIMTCAASFAANKDYYKACLNTVKAASSSAILLYGNDPDDATIGIRNTFYNIEEIINNPGVKDLQGIFKGKPGIVVAAGPSLDKNIDLLHEIQDNAVIIAADASMRIMKAHNLKPHIVTSLERVANTAELFRNLDDADYENVYLAACPVVHPDVYKLYKGKRIIVYRKFATFQWLGIDRGILEIGQSTANMAFKVLEYMGCDPIILIGQDLAFDGENTHASGATFGTKEIAYSNDTEMVPGNYVPQIRTNKIWSMFRHYFEKDIAEYKGIAINATEGGAKILGTQIMTFREVIDKHIKAKPLHVTSTIDKKLRSPFPAQREKDYNSVIKKVKEAQKYTTYLLEITRKGVDEALACKKKLEEVFATSGEEEATKLYDEMVGSLTKCDSFTEEELFYLIYMHYVQSYVMKAQNDIHAALALEPSAPSLFKIINIYGTYFSILHDLIKVMEVEFINLDEHLARAKSVAE